MEMQMEMQMDFGPSTVFPSMPSQVRPLGVSPGIDIAQPGNWYQGNRWPPVEHLQDQQPAAGGAQSKKGNGQVLSQPPLKKLGKWLARPPVKLTGAGELPGASAPRQLPGRQWNSRFYAVAVLGEFVQASIDDKKAGHNIAELRVGNGNLKWDNINLDPSTWLKDAKDIEDELQELVRLMDYRPSVLNEALAQREAIDDYFRGVLSFTAGSHPASFGLMQIALRVGELQAIHYKYKFDRPRASTLLPWLMPPIEVPGHASYPSGHSTQSHLVALILGEVLPDWARGARGPLRQLAQRIARNREVLGLHYPSDSKAGEKLAKASFLLLRECDTVRVLIAAARKEWDITAGRNGGSTLEELGYE
jgi:hypothetical protein